MTIQTALLTAGHYLLIAAGLILLLLIIILAAAFLLTLFLRLFIDISFKTAGDQVLKKISIRLKVLFFEKTFFDWNDFEGETDSADSEQDSKSADSEQDSKSADSDKNTYHLTFTDEKITVQTTETHKSGSDYEIVVHTEETVSKDVRASDGDVQNIIFETPETISETDEITVLSEKETDGIEIGTETVETVETTTTDYEFDKESFGGESENAETETGDGAKTDDAKTDDAKTDDAETDDTETGDSAETDDTETDGDSETDDEDEISEDDLRENLAETYDEIKRYVDLSDPGQFVSDSFAAAVRMSKAAARLTSDLLLRTDINNASAVIIYGLNDPANTAVSFGAVHSFQAGVYAYLADVEKKSRSSKKRKKAGEVGAIIRDDIHIIPDMVNQRFSAEADLSFSFWIPRLYIPMMRFMLNRNSRWVLRHYLYPYFIRHSIKTRWAERKQRRAEKKAAKKAANALKSESDQSAFS